METVKQEHAPSLTVNQGLGIKQQRKGRLGSKNKYPHLLTIKDKRLSNRDNGGCEIVAIHNLLTIKYKKVSCIESEDCETITSIVTYSQSQFKNQVARYVETMNKQQILSLTNEERSGIKQQGKGSLRNRNKYTHLPTTKN